MYRSKKRISAFESTVRSEDRYYTNHLASKTPESQFLLYHVKCICKYINTPKNFGFLHAWYEEYICTDIKIRALALVLGKRLMNYDYRI